MSNAQYAPGIYRGRVTTWGLTKSASKGTNQFVLRFVVLGIVDQSDPEAGLISCPQMERSVYRPITEKTVDWVIDDLQKIFGYDRESFAYLDPSHPGAFNFGEFETNFRCAHEVYQGKTQERWSFDSGSSEITPLEKSEVDKLDALFGKRLKRDKKPATVPVGDGNGATAPTPTPAPVDDGIPF